MSKYASKLATPEGGDFTNPSLGNHPARIAGVQFLDDYIHEFKGKKKPACMNVAIRFKLFDETDDEDNPIQPCEGGDYITLVAPFKWHDLAMFTKVMCGVYPDKLSLKSKPDDDLFDKCIDHLPNRPVQVTIVGDSKENNEDGTPKYVKVGSVSALSKMVAKFTPKVEGEELFGVKMYEEISEATLRWLKPYDIADYVCDGLNYEGSEAQALVEDIRSREGEGDFAKKTAKKKSENTDGDNKHKEEEKPAQKDKEPASTDLDEEDF